MTDVRKAEYEQMMAMVHYITTQYPQFFTLSGYEHPVFGYRDSLELITKNHKSIDVRNINEISISYELNKIIIITSDNRSYVINNFIKDSTVI